MKFKFTGGNQVQTVINKKVYHIIYTIISPLGEKYRPEEIPLYATSEEEAVQTIELEIRRRMGTKYQIEVTCLNGVVPAKLSPPAIRKCQGYNKLFKLNTFNTHTPVLFWMGVK